MENLIRKQKQALLENAAPDLQDEDEAGDEHQEAERDSVEEDSLDDEDLAYITNILNSFSKSK
jgi:hypothetical protein